MQKTYDELLPINGKIFETHEGTWIATLANQPNPAGTDRVCYMVKLQLVELADPPRNLKLWVSDAGLHHDPDKKYQSQVFDRVKAWLETDSSDDELFYFG